MGLCKNLSTLWVIIALVLPPEQCEAFKCHSCVAGKGGNCEGGSPGDEIECTTNVCGIRTEVSEDGKGHSGLKMCHSLQYKCIMKVLGKDVPGCASTTRNGVDAALVEVSKCMDAELGNGKSLGSEPSSPDSAENTNNSLSRKVTDTGNYKVEYCTCTTELCNKGDIKSLGGGKGEGGSGNSLKWSITGTGLQMINSLLLSSVLFRV